MFVAPVRWLVRNVRPDTDMPGVPGPGPVVAVLPEEVPEPLLVPLPMPPVLLPLPVALPDPVPLPLVEVVLPETEPGAVVLLARLDAVPIPWPGFNPPPPGLLFNVTLREAAVLPDDC